MIRFSSTLWKSLLEELGARGEDGARESGAFLLGVVTRRQMRRIHAAIYYDDLDPNSLTGGISFAGSAYARLWDRCEALGFNVVADVHTHPNRWVGQSDVDRRNPMIAQRGHLALIVPYFATRPVLTRELGVHQYNGDGQWSSWLGGDARRRVRIGRWPWI